MSDDQGAEQRDPFDGIDEVDSGHRSSLRRRRSPVAMGESLDRLRRTWGWPATATLDQSIGVVTATLGALVEGASIRSDRHGDLVITVTDPAVAEAIRVRLGTVVDAIRNVTDGAGPGAVRVVVARPR